VNLTEYLGVGKSVEEPQGSIAGRGEEERERSGESGPGGGGEGGDQGMTY